MWLVAQLAPSVALPLTARLVVIAVLMVIALVFLLSGVRAFRKAETTINPRAPGDASELVTVGAYRYSRNPMYVGLLLVLVAWGVWLSNLFALAGAAGFIWYMNRFQIGPEEKALEALFGDAYRDYKTQVRRWL